MSETEHERKDESGAHHLAALLRRSSTVISDGKHDEHEWQRLRYAAQALRAKRGGFGSGWRRWWLVPLGATATLGMVLAAVVLGSTKSELVYKVRATGVQGTSFVADKGKPLDLDFSDGSTVHLSEETQLKLPEVRSTGAILQLERGQAHVAVRHRRDTRWQLQAGPYTVKVTGTRFRAAWDPVHGTFDVDLFEGSVAVQGAKLTVPLPLAEGQHLHAAPTGEVVIRSLEEKPAASTTPSPAERASLGGDSLPSSLPSEPARNPGCNFSPLLTQGRFQAILDQAKARGIAVVQADCPVSELFALSDAARYLGDLTLSTDTLMAIRHRSPENDRAAFFLGRLEEIRGRPRLALKWYALVRGSDNVYLAEARVARQRIEGAKASPDRQPSRKAGVARRAGVARP